MPLDGEVVLAAAPTCVTPFALARKHVRASAAIFPNETSTYLRAKKLCLARFRTSS